MQQFMTKPFTLEYAIYYNLHPVIYTRVYKTIKTQYKKDRNQLRYFRKL